MRFKHATTFWNRNWLNHNHRRFSSVIDEYSVMVNTAKACQTRMYELAKQFSDTDYYDPLMLRLNTLLTYHSLKLTDYFSLSLEDTAYLLKERKTLAGKDFDEQLRALNFLSILEYCTVYRRSLMFSGWGLSQLKKSEPNKLILDGLRNMAKNIVIIFKEGNFGTFDTTYGDYKPPGYFYFHMPANSGPIDKLFYHVVRDPKSPELCDFFERLDYSFIHNGQKLLTQTIEQGAEDPFLNAAIIHNKFVHGHRFDEKFGLLFCRVYMNFALMLTGHVPAIIDSSRKDEYLKLVQQDNLSDPKPLAKFLVMNSIETYQNVILPELETVAKNKGISISESPVKKSDFKPLTEAEKMELHRVLQEAEDRKKFSAY